jgi:hypothetical protein
LSEIEQKAETFIEHYKVWLIGAVVIVIAYYAYSQFVASQTTNASGSSSGSTLGTVTGSGASGSTTSTGDNPTYDTAISQLQAAVTALGTQVGSIAAPVASALSINLGVGGQYDTSQGYQFGNNSGTSSAGGASAGGNFLGLGTIFASGSGSGSNTSNTAVTDIANNTKDFTQSLQFNEQGLQGSDLSNALNQFFGSVAVAQTDANSSGATPAWFVPQGNTPGSQLQQQNGSLVFVQPGLHGNPNNVLPAGDTNKVYDYK